MGAHPSGLVEDVDPQLRQRYEQLHQCPANGVSIDLNLSPPIPYLGQQRGNADRRRDHQSSRTETARILGSTCGKESH